MTDLLKIVGVIALCSIGLLGAGFRLYLWKSGGWRSVTRGDDAPREVPTRHRDLNAELRAAKADFERTKRELARRPRDSST
jgi:hypothetical protein